MNAFNRLPGFVQTPAGRERDVLRLLPRVLDAHWGHGWDRHFRQFSFTPVAASSIGQIHPLLLHYETRQAPA